MTSSNDGVHRERRGIPRGLNDVVTRLNELIEKGLVGRWWCDLCDDAIYYKTEDHENEDSSRVAHDAERHPC
jgi:hypothetical protein